MKTKTRVCYVVCYRDPNYTRTSSLINALNLLDDIELIVVKNRWRGFLRYLEVPLKLVAARLRVNPDVFIVGFRADEIFWALWPAMIGKKIIFDEFIVLHDWLVDEHKKLKAGGAPIKMIDTYSKWIMRKSNHILTDTQAHAKLITETYKVPNAKVTTVPVGADEAVFYPRAQTQHKKFEIFFYGTALPLHGVKLILRAAKLAAAKHKNLHFSLAGGRGNPEFLAECKKFVAENKLGDYISLEDWVAYDKLPERIAAADLCLGGPFGGTGQARRVVSGKTYQFLAMAKPVVVGKIESMSGFKDKSNCLLVEQDSAEELTKALRWAFSNRTKLNSIGQEGRRLFEKRFSSQAISREFERII